MEDHVHVQVGDSSCIGFWDIVRIHKQTDRQTDKTKAKRLDPRLTSAWVTMKTCIAGATWIVVVFENHNDIHQMSPLSGTFVINAGSARSISCQWRLASKLTDIGLRRCSSIFYPSLTDQRTYNKNLRVIFRHQKDSLTSPEKKLSDALCQLKYWPIRVCKIWWL